MKRRLVFPVLLGFGPYRFLLRGASDNFTFYAPRHGRHHAHHNPHGAGQAVDMG